MAYLSIIIPAHNSARTIGQCLEAVRRSSYADYELIVVNDASKDDTQKIAERYADRVILISKHAGSGAARNEGMKVAQGNILVNIDADIVIKQDTLQIIVDHFIQHANADAVTGLLDTEHPNSNFFSQYKNLYMNYIFQKLPAQVSFLFGSICAVRREALRFYDPLRIKGDDTELGQRLSAEGKRIDFLRNLRVVHLKKYNFLSFIKNDFLIPFHWTEIFVKFKGWRQLGKNRTGYAHSPKEQLASIVVACILFILVIVNPILGGDGLSMLVIAAFWMTCNLKFLMFLTRNRGVFFGILSIPVTFWDNLVMALGIMCGGIKEIFNTITKNKNAEI